MCPAHGRGICHPEFTRHRAPGTRHPAPGIQLPPPPQPPPPPPPQLEDEHEDEDEDEEQDEELLPQDEWPWCEPPEPPGSPADPSRPTAPPTTHQLLSLPLPLPRPLSLPRPSRRDRPVRPPAAPGRARFALNRASNCLWWRLRRARRTSQITSSTIAASPPTMTKPMSLTVLSR